MTFDEILQNKPSANYNVALEKRTEGEIKMNGGNDYQLNALDNSTNRGQLKKEVEGYSDGENLYLIIHVSIIINSLRLMQNCCL